MDRRLLPFRISLAIAGVCLVSLLSDDALAQMRPSHAPPVGGFSGPSFDPLPPGGEETSAPEFGGPTVTEYPSLYTRPCPASVEFCGADSQCDNIPAARGDGYTWDHIHSWIFHRYAGSYEMRTKTPYPAGYYGNYYYRPWLPGYVRHTANDFQPGHYERPFYHHVDFYPTGSDVYPTGTHEAIETGDDRPLGQPDPANGEEQPMERSVRATNYSSAISPSNWKRKVGYRQPENVNTAR